MDETDLKICQRCGVENSAELATVANLRVCPACAEIMNNYPFPRWVKNAAIGLAALVVFATLWNMRFIRAIVEMKRFQAAILTQDAITTEKHIAAASAFVPENNDLRVLASFYRGIILVGEDKYDEAIALLEEAGKKLPPTWGASFFLRQAKMLKAFDDKDYDMFLEYSKELLAQHPQVGHFHAGLASAYACKYAETGDAEFRTQALASMKTARALSMSEPEKQMLEGIESRILHSLATREIISSEEFTKRFPDGWNENATNEKEVAE